MSMINKSLSLVAISLLLVVGGCASTSQPAPEAVVEAPVETQAVAEVVEVEPIQPMVQGGRIVLPNDPMDERGTREYNLALGERRANAVQSYLLSQGASRSQIEVVSYGEEKPAMTGHDQTSWEKNRRVEIVYR
jgi:hypothetical protein